MERRLKITFLFFIAIAGCVEPFDAPVDHKNVGFLVVDGYVNTSTKSVSVKLSRAISLSQTVIPTEENATVMLEEENAKTYLLTEIGNGQYEYSSGDIDVGKNYRINIRTDDGRDYRSEFITTKSSPPIDSLTWDTEETGIAIKVNTHDSGKKSIYYRWDFIETWEYNAPFFSSMIVTNGTLRPRPTNEPIYICYQSESASQIITSTTLGLNEDRVGNVEVAFIPIYSQKYSRNYSILVKQYVLSEDGYNYWEQLKISSENLGGLFDPQPSRVKGNIFSATGNETVIGYFDGGSISEKRIFINPRELPDEFKRFPRTPCEELEVDLAGASKLPEYYLITSAKTVNGILVGYYYSVEVCADCRKQGGTTQPPDYWP